jgi:hypothetical protein
MSGAIARGGGAVGGACGAWTTAARTAATAANRTCDMPVSVAVGLVEAALARDFRGD